MFRVSWDLWIFTVNLSRTIWDASHNAYVAKKSRSDGVLTKAFDNLKRAITYAPMLVHANLEKPFIIEVDVFDFSLGSILSKIEDDEKLHLVAFTHTNSKL
mgnify:FL=1